MLVCVKLPRIVKIPKGLPGLMIPELVTLPLTVPVPVRIPPLAMVTVGEVNVAFWATLNVPAITLVDIGADKFSSIVQVPLPCLVSDPGSVIVPVTA